MSTETVLVSEVIFATRQRLYDAWLDSKEHSAFTGEEATIEPVIGGSHNAFSGYASGQNVALEPHRRIIQTWRSSEFPAGAPDSRLEVTFEDTLGGTLITVLHTGIPSGQSNQYRDAWLKYYFAPMKIYFAGESAPAPAPDFDPGALAPAPARKIAKPKARAKAKVQAKAKTKARKPAARPKKKVARPTAKRAKPAARRAKPAAKPAKKRAAKPAKKKPAKKKPAKKKR